MIRGAAVGAAAPITVKTLVTAVIKELVKVITLGASALVGGTGNIPPQTVIVLVV